MDLRVLTLLLNNASSKPKTSNKKNHVSKTKISIITHTLTPNRFSIKMSLTVTEKHLVQCQNTDNKINIYTDKSISKDLKTV